MPGVFPGGHQPKENRKRIYESFLYRIIQICDAILLYLFAPLDLPWVVLSFFEKVEGMLFKSDQKPNRISRR